MASPAPVQGLKIKGKAKSQPVPTTPVKSSPAERRRRRHLKKLKKRLSAEFIDLNRDGTSAAGEATGTGTKTAEEAEGAVQEDDGGALAFVGGEELASPEAGPSRLPMINAPSSFTPLRSILSGITGRRSPSPDLPTSAPSDQAEAVIDDQPAASRPDPAPPPPEVSGHFEPPALFSATLDEIGLPPPKPADKKDDSSVKPSDAGKNALLLPANVQVDDKDRIDGPDVTNRGDDSMEGLHFVDNDMTKGVQRYFDGSEQDEEAAFLASADQSRICTTCKRPGHKQWNCPHIICTVCGAEDEHERRDCPHSLICFGCGQRGHRQNDCPDPTSRNSRKRGCDRCGSREHPETNCPSLWRVYAYWSADERVQVQKEKRNVEGWEQEAIGGAEDEQWCYNCAQEGHLGDDCPQRRASFARLNFPSAFSYAMASRGPFYASKPTRANSGTPTHARWDDDESLPFVNPAFQGSNAGQKSRDKARRAMIEREKGVADSDEDDWFAGGRGEMNIRGRGNGRSTPNQPHRADRGRPWDSDSKRHERSGGRGNGLPFGHGHLMGSAPAATKGKGISFGKLSLPDDSPSAGKPKKRLQANGMLAKALEGSRRTNEAQVQNNRSKERHHPDVAGTPSGKKRGAEGSNRDIAVTPTTLSEGVTTPGSRKAKRKKGKGEDERDDESQWWSSGKGGGSVRDWGKDLDKDKPGKESGTKAKVAKKGRGQQYVGGY